jgi:hypothetical protein
MRKMVSVWLEDEEAERFDRMQKRLEEREGKYPKVTQRLVIVRALERLEAHLDRLDRDKDR